MNAVGSLLKRMPELKSDSDLGRGNRGITAGCVVAVTSAIGSFPYNSELDFPP